MLSFISEKIRIQKQFSPYVCSAAAVTISFAVIFYLNRKQKVSSQKFCTLKYLLIGPPGVGKTKLFKRMLDLWKQKQKQTDSGFVECKLREDIDLVNTLGIDFETIEKREAQIKQFQLYMMNNHIAHFFLLVNFERTDLMKNKIISVLKFFRKFKEKITIIVTDFQLSENEEEDKQTLKQSFKVFLNKFESIIFVKNDFNPEELKNQMLEEAQAFSLNDTIFEPISEEEQNRMVQQLQQRLNNKT